MTKEEKIEIKVEELIYQKISSLSNNKKLLGEDIKNNIMLFFMDSMGDDSEIWETYLHKIIKKLIDQDYLFYEKDRFTIHWTLTKGLSYQDWENKMERSQSVPQVKHQVTNNIGSMVNSQLQQNSPKATQSMLVTQSLTDITDFIENLNKNIDKIELNSDLKDELKADILTIESQVSSPKPKEIIMIESLKSIRNILEGITGSIIATGLLTQIINLF